jgi:hypothetical protein
LLKNADGNGILQRRKRMKTKQEIKEEIIELYGAAKALSEAMDALFAQRMAKSQQMMALNHMLKEMGDDNEEKTNEGN